MGKNILRLIAKGFLMISLVTLMISLGFYAWSFPEVRKTFVLATTVQPERFTELYFEDHLNLPGIAVAGRVYEFKFTIHNLEGRDMTYRYEVYAQVGSLRLAIEQNTALVKKDAYKTITEHFATTSVFPRTEIVVNLVTKKQQIDFWVEGVK